MNGSTQKSIKITFLVVYKIFGVDDKFTKPIVVFRAENAASNFIKAILKEYEYCEKVMKKHFNKNLIRSKEKELQYFQKLSVDCNSKPFWKACKPYFSNKSSNIQENIMLLEKDKFLSKQKDVA